VPKFSESHPLSLQAIPKLVIGALFDYMKTSIFSFQRNEASVLDQLCTCDIPVNYVELELHARSKLAHAPVLGLTRIV
jgi:hypothetical protein